MLASTGGGKEVRILYRKRQVVETVRFRRGAFVVCREHRLELFGVACSKGAMDTCNVRVVGSIPDPLHQIYPVILLTFIRIMLCYALYGII